MTNKIFTNLKLSILSKLIKVKGKWRFEITHLFYCSPLFSFWPHWFVPIITSCINIWGEILNLCSWWRSLCSCMDQNWCSIFPTVAAFSLISFRGTKWNISSFCLDSSLGLLHFLCSNIAIFSLSFKIKAICLKTKHS